MRSWRGWGSRPAADPPDRPPLSAELVDQAVESAAGRRRLRQALGVPSDRRISDEVIDELLAGASTEEEIAGRGGLLAQLTKRLVERALEVELTEHVGYEPHCEPPGGAEKQRNGTTPKTLITEHGKVQVDAPRDRDGSFEPQIVKKRQRRFVGFDEKILALYSRGLSTRDIEAHLQEIASGNPLSPSTHAIRMSLTPRCFRSVRTCIQNFAPIDDQSGASS